MWRVAWVFVFVHRRPRARRGATYASRLFFMVRSRLPSRRFRDFWRVAREIDHHTGIHQVAAADRRDRSFCFPARIDDSKTVGRAGQSSSPYEIGANSAQAAAPFGRGSDRAHGAHPRAQTTPRAEAHGRSKVARFSGASFPRASVRSSAFTQPSPARRPRRCAAAQQNLTRGDRRLWRNPV